MTGRDVPGGPTEADVRAILNTIIDPCSTGAGSPTGAVSMTGLGSVLRSGTAAWA